MTATRRDLRRTLDSMANRVVPEPRSSFVVGLEARLAHELSTRRTVVSLPSRRRSGLPFIGGLTVLGASVVLSGALAGWYGERDVEALELSSAFDTMVMMPDGTQVAGASGLALPDGAVVRTGPHGQAAAGSVELGPGIEALVDSGRLVLHPVTAAPVAPSPVAAVTGPITATSTSVPPALARDTGGLGLSTSPDGVGPSRAL